VSGRAQGRYDKSGPFCDRLFVERSARLCIALLAVFLLPIWTTGAWVNAFQGKVIDVADGDTVTILHGREPETIRLNGIDAPEKDQAFGQRAKRFTSELAFGQVVHVIVRDQDPYGRTVADLRLPDGRSLNHELVRAGYAWWFRRYSNDPCLETLESEARRARRGLWADAQPIAPWEWRQTQHERARPPVTAPAPPLATTNTCGPIIGNPRSRVYHRLDCPRSAAEAESAGHRIAGNCP
jgi:endonuclease YncB( thermonuclease family)